MKVNLQIPPAERTNLANKDLSPSGIMLFAKESGPTSFSSLGVIKKALGTGRVGHTGTLDSFAEGLLVVLVGKMTRLVPYITATSKKYLAVVAFGRETDTLEATGVVIKEGTIPSRQQVEEVLKQFRGKISQVPPLYSAVHVDGQRASDRVRSGQETQLPPREVTIYSLELLDFAEGFGLLEVTCSKGTYIRSLARDLAKAAGSCGHLVALRRVSVGPFQLQDAVFASHLEDFTLKSRGFGERPATKASLQDLQEVAKSLIQFTPTMAASCGLEPLLLLPKFTKDFFQGRPPKQTWFTPWPQDNLGQSPLIEKQYQESCVFTDSGQLVGMIKKTEGRLKYGFVIPQ